MKRLELSNDAPKALSTEEHSELQFVTVDERGNVGFHRADYLWRNGTYDSGGITMDGDIYGQIPQAAYADIRDAQIIANWINATIAARDAELTRLRTALETIEGVLHLQSPSLLNQSISNIIRAALAAPSAEPMMPSLSVDATQVLPEHTEDAELERLRRALTWFMCRIHREGYPTDKPCPVWENDGCAIARRALAAHKEVEA